MSSLSHSPLPHYPDITLGIYEPRINPDFVFVSLFAGESISCFYYQVKPCVGIHRTVESLAGLLVITFKYRTWGKCPADTNFSHNIRPWTENPTVRNTVAYDVRVRK